MPEPRPRQHKNLNGCGSFSAAITTAQLRPAHHLADTAHALTTAVFCRCAATPTPAATTAAAVVATSTAAVAAAGTPEERQARGLQPLVGYRMLIKYTTLANKPIKQAFRSAGFRTSSKTDAWHTLWGFLEPEDPNYGRLHELQRVGRFPGERRNVLFSSGGARTRSFVRLSLRSSVRACVRACVSVSGQQRKNPPCTRSGSVRAVRAPMVP